MLAEAAYLAATADEAADGNFVRKHALAYAAEHGCNLETAALRVFSNASGAYGANVNHLIENGRWSEDDELGATFAQRKSFAYARDGKAAQQRPLLEQLLGSVSLAYQNLESVEVGVTSLDQYFDTLGGISRVAKAARDEALPIFIGDQTRGDCRIRPLGEQVALETHTRLLNPTWYEGLLEHGYEGVRQIQTHVSNTFGWSATSELVEPWVYDRIAATYVTDDAMRRRLAALNPTATAGIAARLREAHERAFWTPDAATLEALGRAEDELEDRIEGIEVEVAA
jgi:magnesium chelatase subunit H